MFQREFRSCLARRWPTIKARSIRFIEIPNIIVRPSITVQNEVKNITYVVREVDSFLEQSKSIEERKLKTLHQILRRKIHQ